MPSPNLSYVGDVIATTLEARSSSLADNVSNNNALLYFLKKAKNLKPFTGGHTILESLMYAQNGTYKRYSGWDLLNIAPSEIATVANFPIKQVAVTLAVSGLEELQNSGQEQMIDLVDERVANAEYTMENNLSADCYSAGLLDGGKQIGGLQYLVPDTSTSGVVGGIDAATWTFWQNISFDCTTDGGASLSAANVYNYFLRMWVQLVRQKDKPTVIISDNNYWMAYNESLTPMQATQKDEETGKAGFPNTLFMGIPHILDGGQGGGCPENHSYFLNTNYLRLRTHTKRNMKVLSPDRFAVNQDGFVRIVGWAGNLTATNRSLQGVIKN